MNFLHMRKIAIFERVLWQEKLTGMWIIVRKWWNIIWILLFLLKLIRSLNNIRNSNLFPTCHTFLKNENFQTNFFLNFQLEATIVLYEKIIHISCTFLPYVCHLCGPRKKNFFFGGCHIFTFFRIKKIFFHECHIFVKNYMKFAINMCNAHFLNNPLK